jgi:hypothetical protein
MQLNDSSVVSDWLHFLDSDLERDHDMWQNRKTLVLDSIEVLNYIRENASPNVDIKSDSRIQSLFDLCQLPCRTDYYNRFLKFDTRFYHNENNWWLDCWQTIRMKNLLHKFEIINLNEYLLKDSDGEYFAKKFPRFFNHSKNKKESNSLAAFSYLECIRLILNTDTVLDTTELDEVKCFLKLLYEKDNGKLKYFKQSNEVRANSLNLIRYLQKKYPDPEYNAIYSSIKKILQDIIEVNKWDQFSFTWCTFFLFDLDKDILLQTKSKIPNDFFVESNWISSRNHTRKPRYALLSLLDKFKNYQYFELVKPNPVVYIPPYKRRHNSQTLLVIDKAIQSFKQVKDIQQKIRDENYNENYFRDLLRVPLSSNKSDDVEYVEKEAFLSSGRTTDLLVVRREGYDIPIEVKILWRFQGNSYEPITEIIEQLTDGNFGIIIVINAHTNPTYQRKYTGFEGWKSFIKDHKTYINGTIREEDDYYGRLKSNSVYSEHISNIGDRQKVVTLLSIMIDLSEYIRSPHLK